MSHVLWYVSWFDENRKKHESPDFRTFIQAEDWMKVNLDIQETYPSINYRLLDKPLSIQ